MKRKCVNCGGPVFMTGDGLGTWHCSNRCPMRHIKVTRFIGAGKEEETKPNRADEFFIPVTVRRHIKVTYA